MASVSGYSAGDLAIAEMREFASFSKGAQRYIRRALDIGLERDDAIARWSRDMVEEGAIRAQARAYHRLVDLRATVPDDASIDAAEPFMAPLISMSAFDLGQDRLDSFGAYRFLYERLLGAAVRPFLPGAFCAAAALPHLHPEKRRALLVTISETVVGAPGWSAREPTFIPEWVDKIAEAA